MKKCSGCGIELQTEDKNKLGYIDNLQKNICTRCFRLSNYGEYKKVDLTNTDYEKIIQSIPSDSLVIYTSDIMSLELSNLSKFKKVLLVVTKRDILPKSVKDYKLIEYIKKKNQNILDVILISSLKNYNLDLLYEKIKNYSNNKDVYLVGNTNTGKSTLLNKLIQNYSDTITNPVTVSMYPSTTLDKVSVKLKDVTIVDTPGLIDKGNIVNYLGGKDLKKITCKKEIKPKSCQIEGKGSILIDNYARIDYETDTKNSMVIYASLDLNIRFCSRNKDDLRELQLSSFNLSANKDIVISGLCFIKFVGPIKVKVYTIKPVSVFERDNLI